MPAMLRLVGFIGLLGIAASAKGQVANLGRVEVYRTGATTVGIPLIVDSQYKLKLSATKRVILTLTVGEHQLEGKIGPLNPVLAINVLAGETTYVVMDYRRPSFGSLMVMRDPAQSMNFILDHTNAPPEGKFKDEEIDEKLNQSLISLRPFHQEEPITQTASVQLLTDAEVKEALLQGRQTPDPKTVGAYLEDSGRAFASALADGQSVSGYTVRVYNAKQWIQLQAAIAAREMRPFSESDVTPDLYRRLLHVVASPSTPDKLTGRNMAAASNVTRIVLEEGPAHAVTQPLSLAPTVVPSGFCVALSFVPRNDR